MPKRIPSTPPPMIVPRFAICALIVPFAAICCGCSNASSVFSPNNSPEVATIRVDGSSTVYPISAVVAEMFSEQRPNSRIVVGYHGTGGGMKKFIAGEIDICDASREMSPSEREACNRNGVESIELQIAYDGIACVTSKENTWCESLTVAQLERIWTPDSPAKNWSDLNPSWPNEELRLYGPGADSGTFDYFTKTIMGIAGKSRADYRPSEDDNVLVHGVASSKFALGYFGLAFFEGNKQRLKLLSVDSDNGAIRPSTQTISDKTYPLWRRLFIYIRKSSMQEEQTREFVEFYLRHASQVVTDVGYVPVEDDILQRNLATLEAYQ